MRLHTMKVRHMMWRDFQNGDFGEDLLRAYYAEVPHEGVPAGGLLASVHGESALMSTVRLKPDTTYLRSGRTDRAPRANPGD